MTRAEKIAELQRRTPGFGGHADLTDAELDRFLAEGDTGTQVMAALPKDDPIMIAWEAYRATPEYENTRRWLAHEEHRDGSLWAAFITGWQAADKNAIHEQQRDD